MDELYVKIFSRPRDDVAHVPLETLITLFTLKYCQDTSVHLILVESSDNHLTPSGIEAINHNSTFGEDLNDVNESHDNESLKGVFKTPYLSVSLSGLSYEIKNELQVSLKAQSCCLPLILLADNATCVAGLCSVLRQIIKISHSKYHHLLGFRTGCLMACAEVSLWTRFCEIDITQMINRLLASGPQEDLTVVIIPEDVMRFEVHMNQPLRTHNILKKRQQLAKARETDEDAIEHAFAEGPAMTLSDIILFPCFHILFNVLSDQNMDSVIPLTVKWFERVKKQNVVSELIKFVSVIERKYLGTVTYEVPTVPIQSLYKSDPKRYKPRSRIYTRQEDIETSLKIVSDVGLMAPWLDQPFGYELQLDWASVPHDSLPECGNLPASRLDRKRQQLENLCRAVMKIAKPNDVIVDFCSGSGHLGLLLAVLLPKCQLLLLENKFESLDRARQRGFQLGLMNVSYVQSNLDYFHGKFDVGVALHACGVATDLVLERCILQHASFVCCPCCYGGVQKTHAIHYPRSSLLRQSALSLRDYLVLGHAADQTHGAEHEKSKQGNRCMELIDADRCQAAIERGYHATMSKLNPTSCTPKNNLLVGLPVKYSY